MVWLIYSYGKSFEVYLKIHYRFNSKNYVYKTNKLVD